MTIKPLQGLVYGLSAYLIWGFFPLYFRQLESISPLYLLCYRVVWAFIFVTLLIQLRGEWTKVISILAQPRQRALLTLSGLLVSSNWLVFLWAVNAHRVTESSLGYFLTPLVSVFLGLLVLKERLNVWQTSAIILAIAAVVNELISLGTLPWVSLFLAASFGLYGLVRKHVAVDALVGLWVETLALLPLVLAFATWQYLAAGISIFTWHDAKIDILLAFSGVLTALPLMLFAAAARRLQLVTLGMLMYINPTLQLLTAVWLFAEPLPTARLTSFALIWLGLIIYALSGLPRKVAATGK